MHVDEAVAHDAQACYELGQLRHLISDLAEVNYENARMIPVVKTAIAWYLADANQFSLEDAVYEYMHHETIQHQ